MNNPTVIITGANGFIGENLVKHFCGLRWNVKAWVHHLPSEKINEVEYIIYNIEESPDEKLFTGVNYLVHCAYLRYEKNNNADKLNINGTKILLELCRKSNVRMLFLSSFSAHQQAESHYGRTKLACEKLFDLSKDIILKPGLVLGNKGLFAEMTNKIQSSKLFPLAGGGRQPVQTIYIEDLCLIIEKALEKNLSGLYAVAEPDAISMKEFYVAIADQANKKLRFIPVPVFFLLLVCKAGEFLGMKLPVSSESVLGLKHLVKFDTKEDLNKLGVPVKKYNESIKALKG